MKGGKKHDKGKPRVDLLPSRGLIEIAKVLGFGASKYAPHNWRGGMAWSRLIGAILRHILAYNEGEDFDKETGLSHLAHAGADILFLLEYEATHKAQDDRWRQPNKQGKKGIAWKMEPLLKPEDIEHSRMEMWAEKEKEKLNKRTSTHALPQSSDCTNQPTESKSMSTPEVSQYLQGELKGPIRSSASTLEREQSNSSYGKKKANESD